MRRIHVIVLLLSAACGQRHNTGDMDVQLINDDVACRDCQVTLREVVTLGDSLDTSSPRPDAAGRECMVGRLSTGEYVVSGLVGGGRINMYSPTGALVRTIGRQGQAPGELGAMVRLAVGRGDSLFVMDDNNLRVQILTPNGTYVRSFSTGGRVRNFTLLNSGQLLLHKKTARPGDFVFYLFSSTGTELARFGQTSLTDQDLEIWMAVPDRREGFWTAGVWKYEVQHWNGPHSLDRTLARDADWFPASETFPEGVYQSVPPPPFLVDLWEDREGRLWTYTLVPDPNWKPGRRMSPSPEWYRATFDTNIEVIDLKSARLIAAGKYEGRLGRMCGSNLMYTVIETPDGDTRIQVIEPTLIGYRGSSTPDQ